MHTDGTRDWHELCDAASREVNSDKFKKLFAELMKILEGRQRFHHLPSGA